jgi:hypothetical protein
MRTLLDCHEDRGVVAQPAKLRASLAMSLSGRPETLNVSTPSSIRREITTYVEQNGHETDGVCWRITTYVDGRRRCPADMSLPKAAIPRSSGVTIRPMVQFPLGTVIEHFGPVAGTNGGATARGAQRAASHEPRKRRKSFLCNSLW